MFDPLGQLFFISMKTVALHTLGCKLNFAETSSLAGQFTRNGFSVVEFGGPADVVVLNTCTVTERADRECRQLVRRALRKSPNAYIIVTGCYAQLQPKAISSIRGVDLVLGSQEKFDLFRYATLRKDGKAQIAVFPVAQATNALIADSSDEGGRTRAFLKVQDGCDYHCSFCTIPLARGRSRSVPSDEVISRAAEIAAKGFREIVLTGVNVGDYGQQDGQKFTGLLRSLERVPGIERIRISSIEPNLLTDDLLALWTASPKICNHFHIPLQSGCDAVLRRMRRRYNRSWYAGRLSRIQKIAPNAGIGADVIVGFPGETDAEFEETYDFLVNSPLSYLHVFTYSVREHTGAAHLPDQVQPRIRSERSERLRILSEKKRRSFYERFLEKEVEVLFETTEHAGTQTGLTREYVRVEVPGRESFENNILRVHITSVRYGVAIGYVPVTDDQLIGVSA